MQVIYNIAQICFQKGITHAVLSPGSRCAPLTISFARHPGIKTITIPDERSAAFIGIGIAQQTKNPSVLICTSGSAAYNYAPAVAESYYQQIPLLVLTADRPPEWIDQLDGQTIRQNNLYGNHVKASFNLPVDYTHPDSKWEVARTISEAINLANQYPAGPVHINIPLREPFYPKEEIAFDQDIKIIKEIVSQPVLSEAAWKVLLDEYLKAGKKLIVAGQHSQSEALIRLLSSSPVPVVSDLISNLHGSRGVVTKQDIIFSDKNEDVLSGLKPDLLITFGNSLISKNLKNYLRKYKPSLHWHIQPAGKTADTFQSLTKVIPVYPEYFFSNLFEKTTGRSNMAFLESWQHQDSLGHQKLNKFFSGEKTFSEFETVNEFLKYIPENSILHLANSMAVRYANYVGAVGKKNVEVFSNRGTSGIDGVISTAYGAAMTTDKIVTVITGDMSFLYDRNAFWNNYLPDNLRILILNNHGGGIFRMIDGPASQPEAEEFFVTHQALTAENTLKDVNIEYLKVNNRETYYTSLADFFSISGKSKVLEVETDGKLNTEVWARFKKEIEAEPRIESR